MKIDSNNISKQLYKYSDADKAQHYYKFFQTQKGGYGEGDEFIGVTVPNIHKIAKANKNVNLDVVASLLKSKIHEERFLALSILCQKMIIAKKDISQQKKIIDVYLEGVAGINNWDLVDISAIKTLGCYCYNIEDITILDKLSDTGRLWEERIAIVATFYFIRQGSFEHTMKYAEKFLHHEHDLIHKAVGWSIREVGKKDIEILRGFLDKYRKVMPRTMLRYAIEKLSPEERKHYMYS